MISDAALSKARRVFLAIAALGGAADRAAADDDKGSYGVVVENDEFFESDHGYTNGIQFTRISPSNAVPDILRRAAPAIVPLFPRVCEKPNCTVRASYSLGQNMYTPRDLSAVDPSPTDRPYAGWLYAGVGLIAASRRDDDVAQQDKIMLQVGMVGPASLAEHTQKTFHELVGAREPRGWDKQIDNEPGVVLTYERSQRYRWTEMPLGATFDLIHYLGGAFGNVSIYANGGATAILGWNVGEDCFGPQRIEPSSQGATHFTPPPSGVEFYVFASSEARLVGRNIFLDGNTWSDSTHVEKRPFTLGSQIGFAVSVDPIRVAFSHVFKSREFDHQGDTDEFGSLNVAIAF